MLKATARYLSPMTSLISLQGALSLPSSDAIYCYGVSTGDPELKAAVEDKGTINCQTRTSATQAWYEGQCIEDLAIVIKPPRDEEGGRGVIRVYHTGSAAPQIAWAKRKIQDVKNHRQKGLWSAS